MALCEAQNQTSGTDVGAAEPYVAPVAQAGVSATVRATPHRLVVDGFSETEPQSNAWARAIKSVNVMPE
jgi:hypothetical protein